MANSIRRSLSAVSRRAMSRSRSRRSRRSIDHGPTRSGGVEHATEEDREPVLGEAVGRHAERGGAAGQAEPDERRDVDALDDAEAARRDRDARRRCWPGRRRRAGRRCRACHRTPRRNTPSDAASSNQLRLAHSSTRRSSVRSAISSSSRSPIWRSGGGGRVRVEVQLAAEPAAGTLGPALAVLQAEHEQGDDEHDAQAGESGRHVQGVDAAQRDRDQQGDPEEQVEHDGRAEAGRGQGEAGVGAADAGQRQQPVAEGRAGGAAARARCCRAPWCSSGCGTSAAGRSGRRPRRAPSGSAGSSENHAAICRIRPATRNAGLDLGDLGRPRCGSRGSAAGRGSRRRRRRRRP